MVSGRNPLFSIVIPTRNEERDIRPALDQLSALTYPYKEILVIDDSTDRTPMIVRTYADKGVRLLQGSNQGRCAARNQGISAARGEIVVVLNADVLLPNDFLERILEHYRRGADYVLVETVVANMDSPYGRFIQAAHESSYAGAQWLEWTEGFSCRRSCALKVGLFPHLPFSRVSGEDGFFGMKLRKRGYRKVIDRSIVVQQIAPRDWREFWHQRRERGLPFAKFFLEGFGIHRLLLWAMGRTVLYLGGLMLIFPLLLKARSLARYSPLGLGDFLNFGWLHVVEKVAFVIATWSGLWTLIWRHNAASKDATVLRESVS